MHIKSHTGLRGLLALLVCPLHINLQVFIDGYEQNEIHWFNGYIAVDLFFILSGFILSVLYAKKLNNLKQVSSFYKARAARIFPLYYATLLCVSLMTLVASRFSIDTGREYYLSHFLYQLIFIQAWPGVEISSWVISAWSLSMEILGYIFLPILIWLFYRFKNIYVNLLLAIFTMTVLIMVYFVSDRTGMMTLGGWLGLGRLFTGMCCGIFLAAIYNTQRENRDTQSRAICKSWHVDTLSILYLITYFCSVIFHLFEFYYIYIITPIWLLVLSYDIKSYTTKLLASRFFLWLGAISYSMYLIHPIIGKVVYGLKSHLTDYPTVLSIAVIFALLLLLSHLSFQYFETPLRKKWIKNKDKSK